MSPRLHLRAVRVALLAAGLGYGALAQVAGPAPLSLTQLTQKAGFIFAGRVLRVERPVPPPGALPLVRVSLRIEQGLRGARRGQIFTFSQWAGAWDNGPQYRPGQRLFLFLHPRGPAGLTSVVGGRLGQFDVDAKGNIVLRGDQQRLLRGPRSNNSSPRAREMQEKLSYRDFAGRVRRTVQP